MLCRLYQASRTFSLLFSLNRPNTISLVQQLDMKVVRSISALSRFIGLEAPLELAALVREDMRRTLTADERQDYHGVTFLGYPYKMSTNLFNVTPTEHPVIAEGSGGTKDGCTIAIGE